MLNIFETLPKRIKQYHKKHEEHLYFDEIVTKLVKQIKRQPEEAHEILTNAMQRIRQRQLRRAFEFGTNETTELEQEAIDGIKAVAETLTETKPYSVLYDRLEQITGKIADVVGNYMSEEKMTPYGEDFTKTINYAWRMCKGEIRQQNGAKDMFIQKCAQIVMNRYKCYGNAIKGDTKE